MQFENLTPFHSMAFQSLDLDGHYCTTVVIKVGYRIVIDSTNGTSELQLIEQEPLPLVLADEHWDDDPLGSIKQESDLAPFKPRCDLLIAGNTHAPEGKPSDQWPVRVRLTQTFSENSNTDQNNNTEKKSGAITLIDKTLYVYAPGYFQKFFFGWALKRDKYTTQIQLRWDYAFGGASKIANPKYQQDPNQPEWLLNEACFSNPVGCGWVDKRHQKFARKAAQPSLETIPAPCIFYPNEAITEPVFFQQPKTAINAKDMQAIVKQYPCRSAGFGTVGRSWAPRVSLTGTYDERWQQERWPLSPTDFDEHYWNSAPQDQQCAWPNADCQLETWFLFSSELAPQGYVQIQLPGHRAFVMTRLQDDTPIPLAANIDTLLLDTEKQQLEVVWRCRTKQSSSIKKLEARFENNPQAPLLKYESDAAQPHTTFSEAV
jgi:hypothetical protein